MLVNKDKHEINIVSEVTLPSHESDKSLMDQFASIFFKKKNTKIRKTFPLVLKKDVHPPSNPPKIIDFTQVSAEAVNKISRNSPTKSCLLYP